MRRICLLAFPVWRLLSLTVRHAEAQGTVAKVTVKCVPASMTVQGTVKCSATVTDSKGNAVGRPGTTGWFTSDPTVATVDVSGTVTGVAAGSPTITATNSGVLGAATITVVAPQSSTPSTDEAEALTGLGTMVQSPSVTDYSNNANVLQTTHLGAATPQFLAGAGVTLPFLHPYGDLVRKDSVYHDPIQVFISAKFAPEASDTLNGFTFGLGHKLISKGLLVLVGYSLNPINEPTPGFRAAASALVKTAQADQTDYSSLYLNFDPKAMLYNKPDAFDGFPTQIINARGTPGALLYQGDPLTTHYHSGIFLGLGVSLDILLLFHTSSSSSGSSTTTPAPAAN